MAGLTEQNKWVKDIYRIQKSDPLLGGQDGMLNIQPEQLGNRTAFLKRQFEIEHNPDGTHCFKDANIDESARLPESLLELDVPTKELAKRLDLAEYSLDMLKNEVQGVVGENGFLANGLAQVAKLNWRYGLWGSEFEFFIDGLTMRDVANIDARGIIGRDDSIDCANTKSFKPGMRLLVSNGVYREEVEIRSVLEKGRIRLTKDLSRTYEEPATLGYTDWDLSTEGSAIVRNGCIFFSKSTDCLANCGVGRLFICRDKGKGELSVFLRESNDDGAWNKSPLRGYLPYDGDDTRHYAHYDITGANVQIKIVGASDEPVKVSHMALFPDPFGLMVRSIRTPHLVFPEPETDIWQDFLYVESSDFLTAYRDYYVQTEYGLFNKDTDTLAYIIPLRKRSLQVLEDLEGMPEPGEYVMKCRHQSDVSEWSLWSDPVPVTLHPTRILFGFEGAKKADAFGKAPFDRLNFYPFRFGFLGARNSDGFDSARVLFTTKLED